MFENTHFMILSKIPYLHWNLCKTRCFVDKYFQKLKSSFYQLFHTKNFNKKMNIQHYYKVFLYKFISRNYLIILRKIQLSFFSFKVYGKKSTNLTKTFKILKIEIWTLALKQTDRSSHDISVGRVRFYQLLWSNCLKIFKFQLDVKHTRCWIFKLGLSRDLILILIFLKYFNLKKNRERFSWTSKSKLYCISRGIPFSFIMHLHVF